MHISVIVPIFNRLRRGEDAVRSVLAQTYHDFELIVVDDGSTEDLTPLKQLVESSGHTFLRIPHGGVARARNTGVRHSRGEWLALLDSDDRWLPEKLEQQVAHHRVHPELRYSQCREIWYRHGERVNPKEIHLQVGGDVFQRSLQLCCISSSSVLLDRRLFEEAGGYDERMRVCEDYDLWLRISCEHRIGLVDTPLAEKFGGHEDQLSKSEPAMDRFRVYSILKLIAGGRLGGEKMGMALKALEEKARILEIGARKRGYSEAGLYGRVREFAVEGVPQGAVELAERVLELLPTPGTGQAPEDGDRIVSAPGIPLERLR